MRLDLRGTGRHRGVTGFAVGVIATMTIAGGGVALASIPSSSTAKFTGCVAKQGGALRVIDAQSGKKCKSSEKKITWSKGWTHRGGWASGTTYKPGDVVTQSGSSYVAKSKSTGVSPGSNASKWGLLAAAGATGATGATGTTGAKGDKGDPATALWAVVNSGGTTVRGSHVVSSQSLATGEYEVIFDQSVSACTYQVSIGGTTTETPVGVVAAARRSGNVNGVFVNTSDLAGADDALAFHLAVFC
jgi:hypothetical protein